MKLSFLFLIAIILFFIGCFVLAVDTALAQDASLGAIRGTIMDPTGLRLSNARVTASQASRGLELQTQSDSEGGFAFPLLGPGDYEIRAEANGMATARLRVRVEVGAIAAVDLRLSLMGTREQVTVSDAAQVVETQSSEIAHVIDSKSIEDLPLNGRRFTDLSLLTPGVTQDPRGLTSSSNGDLAFGGMRVSVDDAGGWRRQQ